MIKIGLAVCKGTFKSNSGEVINLAFSVVRARQKKWPMGGGYYSLHIWESP